MPRSLSRLSWLQAFFSPSVNIGAFVRIPMGPPASKLLLSKMVLESWIQCGAFCDPNFLQIYESSEYFAPVSLQEAEKENGCCAFQQFYGWCCTKCGRWKSQKHQEHAVEKITFAHSTWPRMITFQLTLFCECGYRVMLSAQAIDCRGVFLSGVWIPRERRHEVCSLEASARCTSADNTGHPLGAQMEEGDVMLDLPHTSRRYRKSCFFLQLETRPSTSRRSKANDLVISGRIASTTDTLFPSKLSWTWQNAPNSWKWKFDAARQVRITAIISELKKRLFIFEVGCSEDYSWPLSNVSCCVLKTSLWIGISMEFCNLIHAETNCIVWFSYRKRHICMMHWG